jgi:hypothetical protein
MLGVLWPMRCAMSMLLAKTDLPFRPDSGVMVASRSVSSVDPRLA